MQVQDVAVVGAGIVGLATAHALQRQGATVTVYDPADPGSGQSAGQSRLFRHAHDDERMVELAIRSRAIWRTWERDLGVELVSEEGALALGGDVEGRLAILDAFDPAPARLIGPDEVAAALPLLARYDGPAMLDETGGPIDTTAAIRALAGALGEALVRDQVIGIRAHGDRVEVRTHTGRHEHDRVVICAGTGTAALAAGLGLEVPVRIATLVRVAFALRTEAPQRLATLQDSSGAFGETGAYGTAHPDRRYYSVGLSDDVDVTTADGPAGLAALTERTVDYVRTALPGLDPAPVGYLHCRITELPWHADGCAVWQAGPVSVIAGHNLFKQAPALGRHLADHALGAPLPTALTPSSRLGAPLED